MNLLVSNWTVNIMRLLYLMVVALNAQITMLLMRTKENVKFLTAPQVRRFHQMENVCSAQITPEALRVTSDAISRPVKCIVYCRRMVLAKSLLVKATNSLLGRENASNVLSMKLLLQRRPVNLQVVAPMK